MAEDKRKGVGNVHSHHLIGNYIPDKIFKQQVESYSKFLSSEPFVKYILGFPLFQPLIAFFMGKQPIKALRLLKTKKISRARKIHLKEMKKAGIDYSVVLLLDYMFAADIECGEKLTPIHRQLKKTAEVCAKKPFRFFLFHAFDPRKEYAMALLKNAFEKYGVVGIKLYPALGFHPQPEKNTEFYCANQSLLNPGQSPEQRIQMLIDNLKELYKFAENNNLPILTHCSPGGSYLTLIREEDKPKIWDYSDPVNYMPIAKSYNLRICLAHMGGKIELEEKAPEWRETILENIKIAHNWTDSKGRIYTDLAYDISRILKDKDKLDIYIGNTGGYLGDEIVGKYVMFGSDWPMGLFYFSEKEYIQPYLERLSPGQQESFFTENTARFLFGESKQIHDNYIRFIKETHGGSIPALPPWVREKEGKYYLV